MGEWWYSQEYGCKFVETLDAVFRYDDIQRSLSDEVEPLFGSDEDEITPIFGDAA